MYTHAIPIFQIAFLPKAIIAAIKNRKNTMRICKQHLLLVFDGIKTNPYKQHLAAERRHRRNDAYQNFVIALRFSKKKNLGKLNLEYMSHKSAGLQQLIYERLKHKNVIRADDDSDFLLRRYPVALPIIW